MMLLRYNFYLNNALAKFGGFHQVIKVEDIMKIMEYNVVSTPAIVIDSIVKSTGKLLTVEEVIQLLNKN